MEPLILKPIYLVEKDGSDILKGIDFTYKLKEDEKQMQSAKQIIRKNFNSEKIITHIDEIKDEIVQKELMRVLKEKYDLNIKKIQKNEQSTDNNEIL